MSKKKEIKEQKVYWGRRTTDNLWGFFLEKDNIENIVEFSSDAHMELINEANNTGKLIQPDENGYPILVSYEPSEEEKLTQEIEELKQSLSETDYIVIKIAEGDATAEDYADVLAQRKETRAKINELEKKLSELSS